jgi:hypothetical protein
VPGAVAYRNIVQPAITNFNGSYMGMPAGPVAGSMFQQATSPTSLQVVDATALVQDTTPAPQGITRQDTSQTGQFNGQCKFTNSGQFKYSSKFTNKSVQKGKSFTLDIPATLVQGDSGKQTNDKSQLQITTGPPDNVPSSSGTPTALWIDSSASGFNNQEMVYSWNLDKTVSPVAAQIGPNQSGDIQTTLTATKTLTGQSTSIGVQGQVAVVNVGGGQTQNLQVFNQVQCMGQDGVWKALKTCPIDTTQKKNLAPGQSGVYPFQVNFTPPPGMRAWRNVCLAAITNHVGWYSGLPAGPATGASFQTPANPTSLKVVGGTAQATEVGQCPPGFTRQDVLPTGQTSTGQFKFTGSGKVQFTTRLKNQSAGKGKHFTLQNPSTLIVGDSGQSTNDTGSLEIVTGPATGG